MDVEFECGNRLGNVYISMKNINTQDNCTYEVSPSKMEFLAKELLRFVENARSEMPRFPDA